MASIKGIQLKALKQGIGHDRAGFQANIYENRKKIGTVLDDGWGGELAISINVDRVEFDKKAAEYHQEEKESILSPEELLIYDLLELNNLEKQYKAALKDGYALIIHVDHRPRAEDGSYKHDVPVPYPSEENIWCGAESQIEGVLEKAKAPKYTVYRELSDFVK